MPALVLTAAGHPAWVVPVASCVPQAPRLVGSITPTLAGTLRSDITGRKRRWKVTTAPMARAAADAAVLVLDALPITATGDIPGGSTTCLAEREDQTMIGQGPGAHLMALSFMLSER